MKLLENPTVKTSLIVGAATLAAAAFFVGPEDSQGILANTASSSPSEDAEMVPNGPKGSASADGSRKLVGTPTNETDTSEIVEWGDEAFIDNTEGFDPTPSDDDDGGFNPSPVEDDGGSASDPESISGSASDLPMLGDDASAPVAGGLVPIG
ncbi:MAG: hypothetical protein ABJP34_01855 [Erythrobacter sp.]